MMLRSLDDLRKHHCSWKSIFGFVGKCSHTRQQRFPVPEKVYPRGEMGKEQCLGAAGAMATVYRSNTRR